MKPIENCLEAVVDVMRVPLNGDPSVAVVSVGDRNSVEVTCDVLVIGGGAGGVAAAAAAARKGCSVCLVEETDWLGGQMTSQGVSALDEHQHIEVFGGTASYYRLRHALRDYYRPMSNSAGRSATFNPGNCWVTHLAFEPAVAADHFAKLVSETGGITTYLRAKVAAVTVESDRVLSVLAISLTDQGAWRFLPRIVLDATELGDVLPLTGAEYNVGAEIFAQTGEPHAQQLEPKRQCVQSFTYTFALERRPIDENHVISRPERFDHFRNCQPYSLKIEVHGGEIYSEESGSLSYTIFAATPGTKGGIWQYRRLIDSSQFGGAFANDISMINWPGNDYRDFNLIDRPAHEIASALQDAKRVSLGFLHWLQTEAPADSERIGAPELMLRADVMGTIDGLSKHPYIRESRRIQAIKTITEQEVSAKYQSGPRAEHFPDSVGIGWYPIDIHPVAGEVGVSCRTKPYQIPLGALLPIRISNLVAAAKNIGTTHISNGCYRLHPVEWNIGESAGALAAFSIQHHVAPRMVWDDSTLLASFQSALLADGIPLAWTVDVPIGHPAFMAVQRLFMTGLLNSEADLNFRPDDPITVQEWKAWGGAGKQLPVSRSAAAISIFGNY
jgi:hypothetical protein